MVSKLNLHQMPSCALRPTSHAIRCTCLQLSKTSIQVTFGQFVLHSFLNGNCSKHQLKILGPPLGRVVEFQVALVETRPASSGEKEASTGLRNSGWKKQVKTRGGASSDDDRDADGHGVDDDDDVLDGDGHDDGADFAAGFTMTAEGMMQMRRLMLEAAIAEGFGGQYPTKGCGGAISLARRRTLESRKVMD